MPAVSSQSPTASCEAQATVRICEVVDALSMSPHEPPNVSQKETGLRDALRGLQQHERHVLALVDAARKDGTAIPAELDRWAQDAGSDTLGRDVAERHAAQESLRRSEERYRSVLEHLDEGMVVVQGTRLVFVNARAAEIAEMSVEDMLR